MFAEDLDRPSIYGPKSLKFSHWLSKDEIYQKVSKGRKQADPALDKDVITDLPLPAATVIDVVEILWPDAITSPIWEFPELLLYRHRVLLIRFLHYVPYSN